MIGTSAEVHDGIRLASQTMDQGEIGGVAFDEGQPAILHRAREVGRELRLFGSGEHGDVQAGQVLEEHVDEGRDQEVDSAGDEKVVEVSPASQPGRP
jgi:hypothetical protein